MSTALSNKVFS